MNRRAFLRGIGLAPLGAAGAQPRQPTVAIQMAIPQCPMCLRQFDTTVPSTARPVVTMQMDVTCSCGWSGTAVMPVVLHT